jgi:hypothetical protein
MGVYYHYTTARLPLSRKMIPLKKRTSKVRFLYRRFYCFCSYWFVLGLDAIRTHFHPSAFNLTPLEIGIFSGPVHGIIVGTKQAASTAHLGSFVADGTLFHGEEYTSKRIFWQALPVETAFNQSLPLVSLIFSYSL